MPMWLAARGAAPFQFDPNQDVVIGRDSDCDLFLYSTMLSRRHASVRWQHGVPVLFDLDSLNGTFMGPDRIRRRRLQDGDVFRLGDIRIVFRQSEDPPDPPADSDTLYLEETQEALEPVDTEASLETRIFSRSHAFHQDVFKFNELEQLRANIAEDEALLAEESVAGDTLADWWAQDPDTRSKVLLSYLRFGVAQPSSTKVSLHALAPDEVAQHCVLSQRGGKLRRLLTSGRATWNEMASLRYQSRRSPIFHAMRSVARAYRPAGGLDELDVPTLYYELESLYAADLGPEVIANELRTFLVLGVLQPRPGTGWEAWFPTSWSDPDLVQLSARGLNLLHGFRLEDLDT